MTGARPVRAALLAPGAGAGSDQPALVAVDAALTRLGIAVERMDFPYRLAGRRAPDRPAVLEGAVRANAEELAARAGTDPATVLLGGRSMGGRICSQAVGAGLPAAGLVLVSYPLHPPGRPDRPRTAHLRALAVPCLFVSGTRDAFAAPHELEEATGVIRGPVSHVWIEGGDHGLRGRDGAVADAVARWVEATLRVPTPGHRHPTGHRRG